MYTSNVSEKYRKLERMKWPSLRRIYFEKGVWRLEMEEGGRRGREGRRDSKERRYITEKQRFLFLLSLSLYLFFSFFLFHDYRLSISNVIFFN